MTEQLHFHFSLSCIGEGNGNPLQCSCLENPRDGGAWWAAVYGVAQSWTRLKWFSSSSSSSCLNYSGWWFCVLVLVFCFDLAFDQYFWEVKFIYNKINPENSGVLWILTNVYTHVTILQSRYRIFLFPQRVLSCPLQSSHPNLAPESNLWSTFCH